MAAGSANVTVILRTLVDKSRQHGQPLSKGAWRIPGGARRAHLSASTLSGEPRERHTFYLITRFHHRVRRRCISSCFVSVAVGTLLPADHDWRSVYWPANACDLGIDSRCVLPFTLALPFANLFWTTVPTPSTADPRPAFSAIVVYAQNWCRDVGLHSRCSFSRLFGMGGLGAAAPANPRTVSKPCSFQRIGLLTTAFLPMTSIPARARRSRSTAAATGRMSDQLALDTSPLEERLDPVRAANCSARTRRSGRDRPPAPATVFLRHQFVEHFPGWRGIVYSRQSTEHRRSREKSCASSARIHR